MKNPKKGKGTLQGCLNNHSMTGQEDIQKRKKIEIVKGKTGPLVR